VNNQKVGCRNLRSVMLKNICKSLVKKLLLTMKKLKLTLTNLQKQYLMKTLAMNKFTMLME
jgi:hypothetical protein